tara:strand:- start:231 stop:398 length:168 start_codon:yes stop_codon:yes gene_type:complete
MIKPPKGFSSQTSYSSAVIAVEMIVILFVGALAIQVVSKTSDVNVNRCSQQIQKQ